MERFASYFLQSYKKCKHKHLHFLISGKPSKLSDTKNPDWVPINTSKVTVCCSRSKERSAKKIKLEVLSNKQKTFERLLVVDTNKKKY